MCLPQPEKRPITGLSPVNELFHTAYSHALFLWKHHNISRFQAVQYFNISAPGLNRGSPEMLQLGYKSGVFGNIIPIYLEHREQTRPEKARSVSKGENIT